MMKSDDLMGGIKGPMAAMLAQAQGSTRFHMPGHLGALDPFDMTEIAQTDDLYAPSSAIREAERLAALSCGAAHTLLLTGGSTAGLMAMLLTAVPPGGKVLLPRNVHHAVLSACIWGDIHAIFVGDMMEGIQSHPDADALLVTRPDYYGICLALPPLIAAAHARGMLVLVDEAHGAHFPWWDAPRSAGILGADAFVQSAHKTLPALTGAAFLHLGESQDPQRARRFLRMVQTSSPPFPILRSLDNARAFMDAKGREALSALLMMLADVRTRLVHIPGYRDIRGEDPTRLVIHTGGRGLTGMEAQALLSQQGIDVEMADDRRLVCISTVCHTPADFDALLSALAGLPLRPPLPDIHINPPPPGTQALSLRQAALSPQEAVPLKQARGRIASLSAGMVPPGIPALLPGEVITEEAIAFLARLPETRRFGVEDGKLICIKGGIRHAL